MEEQIASVISFSDTMPNANKQQLQLKEITHNIS